MQSRHNIFELGNGFPTRHGTAVFHAGRKLFADSFLLDMAPLCFLPAGNCLRRVSYSTWHHRVSCRQETICEGFPVRHGTIVFLAGRKLFAKGFLFGLTPLCFNATGNCLRIVSYSTWHHCVSYRQETICERFPIRLDAIVFLTGRKLFANGFLFDLAPPCFLPTGNCSRRVSYSTDAIVFQYDRKLFAKGFLLNMAPLCFLPTGNYLRRVSWST